MNAAASTITANPPTVLRAWATARGGVFSLFVAHDPWGRPYRCELVIDGDHERTVRGDSWDDVEREAAELVLRNPGLEPERDCE